MLMPMMRIRVMLVAVRHRLMTVRMAMRLTGINALVMRMPMVFVVNMLVVVFHRFVRMKMLVALRQVEPDPNAHRHAGDDQLHREWLAKKWQRQGSAKKGGH